MEENKNIPPEQNQEQDQSRNPRRQPLQTKTLLVYLSFILVFLVVMWLILKPKSSGAEEGEGGINNSLPESTEVTLDDDKMSMYERSDLKTQEEKQDSALIERIDKLEQQGIFSQAGVQGRSIYEDQYGYDYNQQNVQVYGDEWYDQQNEIYSLQEENEKLRSELEQSEANSKVMLEEVQKAMSKVQTIDDYRKQKEIDYELAAKYGSANQPADPSKTNPDIAAVSFLPSQKRVVSSLTPDLPDSVILARYSQPRNIGFHSVESENLDQELPKNAVKVEVDRTTVLKPGDYLALRLQEAVRVGTMILPRGTRLTGVARLSENRMKVIVNSIEYQDRIFSTELTAFDIDGQEGLYVPLSAETSAIREAAGAVAQSPMSGGISFNNSSAKEQILTDVARSLIRGGAGYVNKKVSEVRITVKAGYRLYLVPSKR